MAHTSDPSWETYLRKKEIHYFIQLSDHHPNPVIAKALRSTSIVKETILLHVFDELFLMCYVYLLYTSTTQYWRYILLLIGFNRIEMKDTNSVRIEEDLLGTKEVSNEFYYGIHTLRAIENFKLSNQKFPMYLN